jgi:hypothetical protein
MMTKMSTAFEVENDSSWHDGDDLMGLGSDTKTSSSVRELINNSISSPESECTPSGEAEGIDLLDEIHW